jgi:nucleoside-diphosphate-sugar epimerase
MTTSLVTGAAGFVGSHLSRELLKRDHEVVALDNFETGARERVENLETEDGFQFVEGDLRTEETVKEAAKGVDYVFHQAAVPSVPRSLKNPKLTTTANCVGTTNLLVAAREAGVEKVVAASSSSVYGSGGEIPASESDPVNPESPYALSKYWTEKMTLQFAELFDIDGVALRYFNVFGPGQDPDGEYAAVIPKFIEMMMNGERPVIYGDGEQSRDFTYIDNVVQANIKAALSDCNAEALNVACGGRVTINSLAERLNDEIGTDLEPKHDDPRAGDVRHSQAEVSKAQEQIGYEPTVDFETGLKRTVAAFSSE